MRFLFDKEALIKRNKSRNSSAFHFNKAFGTNHKFLNKAKEQQPQHHKFFRRVPDSGTCFDEE